MSLRKSSVDEYNEFLRRGLAAVAGQLRTTPNDSSLQNGLREYRRIFGMLGAMTDAEASSPWTVIDSGRIRRIARGAETTDQEVIQLLFSYREFCEHLLKANWLDRRDSA